MQHIEVKFGKLAQHFAHCMTVKPGNLGKGHGAPFWRTMQNIGVALWHCLWIIGAALWHSLLNMSAPLRHRMWIIGVSL